MNQSPYEKPSLETALVRLNQQERKIEGLAAKLRQKVMVERKLDKARMALKRLVKAIDSGDTAKIGKAYDIATAIIGEISE